MVAASKHLQSNQTTWHGKVFDFCLSNNFRDIQEQSFFLEISDPYSSISFIFINDMLVQSFDFFFCLFSKQNMFFSRHQRNPNC